jgi:hypothetical protein
MYKFTVIRIIRIIRAILLEKARMNKLSQESRCVTKYGRKEERSVVLEFYLYDSVFVSLRIFC